MSKYILALDQGTTSSRAILFDIKGQMRGIAQKEITQFYPKPGWVEQNAEEIWESQWLVAKQVLSENHIDPAEILAIGITNQRETTIVWDKLTGKPIYNAIVWQDKRTTDICNKLKTDNLEPYVRENTGLVIDSYFSGTKLKWILNHIDGAQLKAEKGELAFGTVDSWIIWKLSNGKNHITDYTNASRTLLFNINQLTWDKKLMSHLGIPEAILPKIVPSSGVAAYTDREVFFGVALPIAGIAGDQQAALFGQAAFEPGTAKNTYGTGCFILQNTGTKKVDSKQGLITTLTCQTEPNRPQYALEGSVFVAGAAIKWLRDALHLIYNASETESISKDMANSEGVYVVPAFAGLGAPYWDMYARGAIFGLTFGTTDKHIVKATLESLAYQSKDVLEAMQKDADEPIKTLFVDGGAAANNYLMQFQADILNTNVYRPKNIESTALGAAYLAGLAVGFWNTKEEIIELKQIDHIFTPAMNNPKAIQLYEGWQRAVRCCLKWEKV